MTRPLVYVAGPITGDPWGCIRKAIVVGNTIRDAGAVPFLPQLSVLHEIIQPLSHDQWLIDDLEILSRCDGLVRLPGDSRGADRETDQANALAIPVHRLASPRLDPAAHLELTSWVRLLIGAAS